jgi:hypothetical protein
MVHGGEHTFTLQLLYLWTARVEEAGYARPGLDLVEKGISAPTRNGTPVIQPTMQSFYRVTHCWYENNLQVQEIRFAEKADSGYVLHYTGCSDQCWRRWLLRHANGRRAHLYGALAVIFFTECPHICLYTLTLHIPWYVTSTQTYSSAVVR